jgi:hypothetical protein
MWAPFSVGIEREKGKMVGSKVMPLATPCITPCSLLFIIFTHY